MSQADPFNLYAHTTEELATALALAEKRQKGRKRTQKMSRKTCQINKSLKRGAQKDHAQLQ